MRALLTIGVPMALAQLVQFSPYIADTLMIGRIGPNEIAAAAIGSVLYFLLWMLANGPIAAVTPLVSQALGRDKNERRDIRRTVRMSVWVCFLMFPFILGLLLLTEPIMILAGQDPDVARLAQTYVLVLAPGLPFTLAVMTFRNFLATIEKTMVPFLLIASASLVNIALNWVLIFGNLGAPALGLLGAGIASSIACIYSFFAFVIYMKWDSLARSFDLFSNLWKPDWERMGRLLKIGWPISITFDAVQVACNQLLRGLADVTWPMIITGISYWTIGFPIAFVTALHTDIGAVGVWYGLTAGLIAAFIGLGIRLWLQLQRTSQP